MIVTLANKFHGTTAAVRPELSHNRAMGWVKGDASRRAFRKLCGMSDCKCNKIDVATIDDGFTKLELHVSSRDKIVVGFPASMQTV